ncbi:MAG: hypothetical protein AAGM67_13345, partial [Bacteroidota bacterium]
GELVASVEVEAELSMSLEAEVRSVPLSGIQGQHDLYLVFKPLEGETSDNPLYALDWMEFVFDSNL